MCGKLEKKSNKVLRRELYALQSNRAKCRGGGLLGPPPPSLFRVKNVNVTYIFLAMSSGSTWSAAPLALSADMNSGLISSRWPSAWGGMSSSTPSSSESSCSLRWGKIVHGHKCKSILHVKGEMLSPNSKWYKGEKEHQSLSPNVQNTVPCHTITIIRLIHKFESYWCWKSDCIFFFFFFLGGGGQMVHVVGAKHRNSKEVWFCCTLLI